MSWRELADIAQETILDEFAERDRSDVPSVTYAPEGGVARAVRGIFREPHVERVMDALTAPVSTWEIKVGVKIQELLPDWPLKPASRFVVRRPYGGDPLDDSASISYAVIDHKLDGEGLVELMLRRKD